MLPTLELLIGARLMASQIMERLRKEALGLSEVERAELARDLVKSLDGPADISAAMDWDVEIVRRIEQIDAGTARTIDRDEFSRRLRERTGRA
jgi:putative addiction module component (TIGR02574 family)